MLEMYKGVVNSPETTITNDINNTDTIIYVLDETRIPEDLPNLMVLGTGVSAETVKVVSIEGNAITVERGFQGVPRSWNAGTIIARNFTEYDYNALKENVTKNKGFIGNLVELLTTAKDNLVNAINELFERTENLEEDLETHKAESASKHITESGSNANGEYIKFDDGTMICWKEVIGSVDINIARGSGYESNAVSQKAYPHLFTGVPILKIIVKDSRSWGDSDAGTGGATGVIRLNSFTTRTALEFGFFAIGRWK